MKKTRSGGPARGAALVALAATLASREAAAWNRDVHAAIIQAARRVSPAFEARLPADHLKDVLKGAAEADPGDLVCSSHRGDREDLEAYNQAVKVLQELKTPRPGRRPEVEAALIGRFLHYVADCAGPRIAFGPGAGKLQAGAYDAVVFREKRPLTEPLVQALKARAQEAFAADAVVEAATPALRDAVNLTIDAAMLLPVRGAAAEDRGPVLFWISNFMKFGTPQDPATFARSGDIAHEKWAEAVLNTGPKGDSTTFSALAARGVHVVEWVPSSASGTVKVLLFNNQGSCARSVELLGDTWRVPLKDPVPPFSLKRYEVQAPAARVPPRTSYIRSVCGEDTGPQTAFSAVWSVLYSGWILGVRNPGSTISASPLLEGREVKVPLPQRAGRAFDVEFDPAAVFEGLGKVMRLVWFVALDSGDAWTFQVEGDPVGGAGWKRRAMVLRVEITDPSAPRVEKEVVLNAELTDTKPIFSVKVPATTASYKKPRFRVVSAAFE